ncbi:MAG: glycoside hydrolase family 38 N-terminal domain-containing protein [Myxococcales bacterium]
MPEEDGFAGRQAKAEGRSIRTEEDGFAGRQAKAEGRSIRTEDALRERLGIPEAARRVLLFSESSHWDTSWLSTSEEYFERRLVPILRAVLGALERDSARVYCLESVFFLKLFWERRPQDRERLARLVERRQLRLLSASLTTADTLLPHPEALLRDFHLGQAWLRESGLPLAPRLAYFPDNFGHSPHLPTLMRAVGVDAIALTRIDGMHFVGADWRPRRRFPLAGSSAALLQRELRTLDFVWRADDGAEVLCHWNAFGYFQGDMIAHAGAVRWNGHVFAIPWRTRRHLQRRIDAYVRDLAPLSRTPYLLCPVGMDFNDPIEDFRELLDRYNRERGGESGTWATLAGLDDYFDLVGCRREALPVLSLDPNPYWMGCYASRPELKRRPRSLARNLVLAESLSALGPEDPEIRASLREGWNQLVLVNHHDAITGTSPDRVYEGEQRGWLDAAERAAARALLLAGRSLNRESPLPQRGRGQGEGAERLPCVLRRGPDLSIESSGVRLVFSEARGGCLTSLVLGGRELLAGLGFDLVAHADEGGLWRLGHEYLGGSFRSTDRTSRRPARLEVAAEGDALSVTSRGELHGRRFRRTVTVRAGEPFVEIEIECAAAPRQTVTCRLDLAERAAELTMDTVGGRIRRPAERLHRPTFWPVPSQASLPGGLHAVFDSPSAVSLSPQGSLEWITARNATKERAFGFLPILAHPIGGSSDGAETHRTILFHAAGEASAAALRRRADLALAPAPLRPLHDAAAALIRCDDPAVAIAALRRAEAGRGLVVRLAAEPAPARTVRLALPGLAIAAAYLCDALERDRAFLGVECGEALVPVAGRLTCVRLVLGRPV